MSSQRATNSDQHGWRDLETDVTGCPSIVRIPHFLGFPTSSKPLKHVWDVSWHSSWWLYVSFGHQTSGPCWCSLHCSLACRTIHHHHEYPSHKYYLENVIAYQLWIVRIKTCTNIIQGTPDRKKEHILRIAFSILKQAKSSTRVLVIEISSDNRDTSIQACWGQETVRI